MGFSKTEQSEAKKIAEQFGYRESSDGSKMINDKGGSFKLSDTGGSGSVNGSKYNDLHNLKKSKGW